MDALILRDCDLHVVPADLHVNGLTVDDELAEKGQLNVYFLFVPAMAHIKFINLQVGEKSTWSRHPRDLRRRSSGSDPRLWQVTHGGGEHGADRSGHDRDPVEGP